MNLDAFEELVKSRRAIRNFKPDPIDPALLERLLEIAQWAPSGYNLQPTHYVIVGDAALKKDLCGACMSQRQVLDAPVAVVFTGDRKVVENNFDEMIKMETDAGIMNPIYEEKLRQFVPLAFSQEPFGFGWLWKAALPPIVRIRKPVPSIPAVHKSYWLAKQVMLNAMVFMLAANAAGLATVPMEGFDETRVKRVLNIPKTHLVALVVPTGYTDDIDLKKTRLPLEKFLHYNGWGADHQ